MQYNSFRDFYPHYLNQHSNRHCRRMHFLGTGLAIVLAAAAVATQSGWLLLAVPLAGYGGAWAGHFLFERNQPAAFKNPWWSLRGDFVMFGQMLTGRIKF